MALELERNGRLRVLQLMIMWLQMHVDQRGGNPVINNVHAIAIIAIYRHSAYIINYKWYVCIFIFIEQIVAHLETYYGQ